MTLINTLIVTISGFWGFVTVFLVAIVILAINFSTKSERTYVDKNGTKVKKTSYEFGWGINKENKD